MDTQATDIELIQKTVQYYFDGCYHSDVEKLKKAFHPNSQVIGYFDGSLSFESLDGFLEFIKATPAPSESGEEYDMKIVSIDVTANEAVAKVTDLYLGLRFTDYLSLLKVDGNWVIVNKMYYYEPKE
ncbi:MAG: nuclear transport factor 2 family protein [Gammaproteobacteria bacterium]|nr:nuclear transport factor 2 family protein [Gammaproteobacteria bacterium]